VTEWSPDPTEERKMVAFVPQSREAAVAEYVRVARDYFRNYPKRPGSIGRAVARKLIRKAKAVKAADDWFAEVWKPLDQYPEAGR
jgi:hypothetical protein